MTFETRSDRKSFQSLDDSNQLSRTLAFQREAAIRDQRCHLLQSENDRLKRILGDMLVKSPITPTANAGPKIRCFGLVGLQKYRVHKEQEALLRRAFEDLQESYAVLQVELKHLRTPQMKPKLCDAVTQTSEKMLNVGVQVSVSSHDISIQMESNSCDSSVQTDAEIDTQPRHHLTTFETTVPQPLINPLLVLCQAMHDLETGESINEIGQSFIEPSCRVDQCGKVDPLVPSSNAFIAPSRTASIAPLSSDLIAPSCSAFIEPSVILKKQSSANILKDLEMQCVGYLAQSKKSLNSQPQLQVSILSSVKEENDSPLTSSAPSFTKTSESHTTPALSTSVNVATSQTQTETRLEFKPNDTQSRSNDSSADDSSTDTSSVDTPLHDISSKSTDTLANLLNRPLTPPTDPNLASPYFRKGSSAEDQELERDVIANLFNYNRTSSPKTEPLNDTKSTEPVQTENSTSSKQIEPNHVDATATSPAAHSMQQPVPKRNQDPPKREASKLEFNGEWSTVAEYEKIMTEVLGIELFPELPELPRTCPQMIPPTRFSHDRHNNRLNEFPRQSPSQLLPSLFPSSKKPFSPRRLKEDRKQSADSGIDLNTTESTRSLFWSCR